MRSEVISARVPQRLFLAITAIAEKEGKKVSEVVREAIALRVLLAQLQKPEPAPPVPPPAKKKREGVEIIEEIEENEEGFRRRLKEVEEEIEKALKS